MPDLSALATWSDIATTLGGLAAFLAAVKFFRGWGGMEEKFAASLKAIASVQADMKIMQVEQKAHGEAIAGITAAQALIFPRLANTPTPGGNGASPPIETSRAVLIRDLTPETMAELGTLFRWIAERFEQDRLMNEGSH